MTGFRQFCSNCGLAFSNDDAATCPRCGSSGITGPEAEAPWKRVPYRKGRRKPKTEEVPSRTEVEK